VPEFNYNRNVFAFQDSELWNHIVFILEQNIDAEVNNALRGTNSGEGRIHACGRAEAMKDLLSALLDERKHALDDAKGDFIG
jgi:hypothetical protein